MELLPKQKGLRLSLAVSIALLYLTPASTENAHSQSSSLWQELHAVGTRNLAAQIEKEMTNRTQEARILAANTVLTTNNSARIQKIFGDSMPLLPYLELALFLSPQGELLAASHNSRDGLITAISKLEEHDWRAESWFNKALKEAQKQQPTSKLPPLLSTVELDPLLKIAFGQNLKTLSLSLPIWNRLNQLTGILSLRMNLKWLDHLFNQHENHLLIGKPNSYLIRLQLGNSPDDLIRRVRGTSNLENLVSLAINSPRLIPELQMNLSSSFAGDSSATMLAVNPLPANTPIMQLQAKAVGPVTNTEATARGTSTYSLTATTRNWSLELWLIYVLSLTILIFAGVIIVFLVQRKRQRLLNKFQVEKSDRLIDKIQSYEQHWTLLRHSISKWQAPRSNDIDLQKIKKQWLSEGSEHEQQSQSLLKKLSLAVENMQNFQIENLTVKPLKSDSPSLDNKSLEADDFSVMIEIMRKIEEKTQVIHEIVFQTKLLSFNASVEAARAGEQGRGFAVVADEIGALARLSGQAAREITQLLKTSTDQVKVLIESKVTNKRVAGESEADRSRQIKKIEAQWIGMIEQLNQQIGDFLQWIQLNSRKNPSFESINTLVQQWQNDNQAHMQKIQELIPISRLPRSKLPRAKLPPATPIKSTVSASRELPPLRKVS